MRLACTKWQFCPEWHWLSFPWTRSKAEGKRTCRPWVNLHNLTHTCISHGVQDFHFVYPGRPYRVYEGEVESSVIMLQHSKYRGGEEGDWSTFISPIPTAEAKQDAATTQLTHGHNYSACKCPCASCMLLLHPAPTCTDGCWWPVPLTFSNLRWWYFSFQQLPQALYLHLWWLPSATCTGDLFPSNTGAYSDLHCVVVVVVVVVVYV